MSEKVILILVDGMRPDGMMQCGNPFAQKMVENIEKKAEEVYNLTMTELLDEEGELED